MNEIVLREFIIESLLREYEETRLDKSLTNVTLRVSIDSETHIPDTMTRIRVLPTVAVVGQTSPINRTESNIAKLECYVKFLPNTSEVYRNLLNLAKLIRSLPGVKMVKILTLDNKVVSYKNKPIVV
tara:strand:+ start:6497 stop:6877 length:381 start_codon:yes stop_codon:yes gene_type:complete